MIVGKMESVHVCSLLPELSFEDYLKSVDNKLSELEGYTIALVDLFGGTPCNTFTVLSKKYNYDVVTGLNLPMLIDLYLKLSSIEDGNVDNIVEEIKNAYSEACVCTTEKV